ncbi:hypothetical protein SAMN06298226_0543 [Nitrosovibrio sp. Nv4]|nr:hypothetical protein SAMN06298226_0543 [Nitrosovibrio sp. Nv4]
MLLLLDEIAMNAKFRIGNMVRPKCDPEMAVTDVLKKTCSYGLVRVRSLGSLEANKEMDNFHTTLSLSMRKKQNLKSW